MTINELQALQHFYARALERHATLRAPSKFQLDLQAILFDHHHRVTEILAKLL